MITFVLLAAALTVAGVIAVVIPLLRGGVRAAAPGVLLLVGAFVSWRIVRARIALVPSDNQPLEEDPSR